MTTIDRIMNKLRNFYVPADEKYIREILEAELTAVKGVDELIQVPICNDCHKPHYGRRKAEDRCQCDTSGNFTMGEITKEQEERLNDSQPKEVEIGEKNNPTLHEEMGGRYVDCPKCGKTNCGTGIDRFCPGCGAKILRIK